MAAEISDIRGEVKSILEKQKGIMNPNLLNVTIIEGMNPKVIAELYAFRQHHTIQENFPDSFTQADLIKIYNNLATEKVTELTVNMRNSLLLTLFRYNW